MRIAIFFISLTLLIAGCKKKDNTIIDPPTEINFSIERVNSDNDNTSELKQFSLNQKSESWRINTFNDISFLSQEIMFNVELENEENMEFGFWFGKGKNLNKEDVLLEESGNENTGLWGNKWKYKDFDFGVDNFYKSENLDFRILVGGTVIFTNFNSNNVKLIALEKAIVNGEEKVYAEFNFEGIAYGWYDPEGEFSAFYKITNGSFKGIID